MKLTDQSNGQFAYSCEFAGITGTDHSLVNTSELIWCSHTLEAYETDSNDNPPYDLRSLAEYPAADSIAFESISVQTAAGLIATLWDPQNVVTNFGEHTLAPGTASTDSEVTIFFH